MNAVPKKKGLGRGLEALLGGSADITEAVKIEGAPNTLALGKLQAGSTSRVRGWTKAACRSSRQASARRA